MIKITKTELKQIRADLAEFLADQVTDELDIGWTYHARMVKAIREGLEMSEALGQGDTYYTLCKDSDE